MSAPLLLDARRVLFAGLIDYAGLFPPASLAMEDAVAEYRAARSGRHGWMLARFICTASRLEELARVLTATMVAGEPPWPISVVLDGDIAAAAAAAQSFDAHMGNAAEVVLVEARLPAEAGAGDSATEMLVRDVATTATAISPTIAAFLEIPRTDAWEVGIPTAARAIASAGAAGSRIIGAKIRCGGIEATAFPSAEQIARFLVACRDAGVPYKATAGLHHPVRHHDDELGVMMHGFLNVLAAGGLADMHAAEAQLIEVLDETDPDAFVVNRAGLESRGHRISIATLKEVREHRFPSYGSCSFDEPVADLITLGILED